VIFTAICFVVAGGSFIALMTAATELQGVTDPGVEALQPLMAAYAGMVWLLPLMLVFSAIMYAAVNRAVLTPADSRLGYLRLGMDEVRVFVVTLVLTILAIIAAAIIFGVAGVIAGLGGAAAGDAGGIVVFLVILAAVVLSVWLALRLSLAVPITMARKKIAIFDSWSVTRGRALGLLGMTVIALVMMFVVSILASIIILPIMFFAGGGMAELMAMETTDFGQIMSAMGPAVIIYLIYNAVVSALTVAILYAPYAAAYRDITGSGETLAQAEVSH
jgi:hypothetical protein